MSRFPSAPFSDPQYDMRSHQASHYGASHDRNKREFTDFVAQRVWFVEQYAHFWTYSRVTLKAMARF